MKINTLNLDHEYRYFTFMDAKDALHKKYHVGDRECYILRVITRAYLSNEKVRVTDILKLKEFASPATLHGILKTLIQKKNVLVVIDPQDNRNKYIEPTPLTLKMYKEMTKSFMKVSDRKD